MNQSKFGIVTPSYAPDFARCQTLCWSIDKFVAPDINHYIVVDRQDYQLFSQLAGPRRKIITKESILPWWIKRVPFLNKKNLWLSYKTLPLRGWLVQQIIKLSAARYTTEETIVFVDSDVIFVRPFDLNSFVKEGQVRLFKVDNGNVENIKNAANWDRATNHLIGLSDVEHPHNYVGQIITWKRDNLLKLYQHIEDSTGKNWLTALCGSLHLSEYHLYGNFIDCILQERSGHFYDDSHICHQYWDDVSMSKEQLQAFFAEIPPTCIAVMLSAKADMTLSPEEYQNLVDLVPDRALVGDRT